MEQVIINWPSMEPEEAWDLTLAQRDCPCPENLEIVYKFPDIHKGVGSSANSPGGEKIISKG